MDVIELRKRLERILDETGEDLVSEAGVQKCLDAIMGVVLEMLQKNKAPPT